MMGGRPHTLALALVAAYALAAGCGRFRFEDAPDAALDAAPACASGTATPLRAVTECPYACHNPKLLWINDSYVLCWKQETSAAQTLPNQLVCTRLARDGEPIESPTVIPTQGEPTSMSLTWNGDTFTLSYTANTTGDYEIYMLRFDAQFVASQPIRLTSATGTSWGTSNAWTGAANAIAFYDYRSDPDASIYLVRADRDGTNLGETRITTGFAAFGTTIAWTGNEVVVGWRDLRDSGTWDAYVQRLDSNGAMIGGPVRVTDNSKIVSTVSVAWRGDALGVLYSKGGSTGQEGLFVRVLDAQGLPVANESQLTDPPGPIGALKLLSRADSTFLAGFFDERTGISQPYFRFLDPSGAPRAAEIMLDAPPYFTGIEPNPPAMADSGIDIGAVWPVGTSVDAEIMFTAVCP